LSDQEIWQIYNLLTNIEASFKSLKQDLNVRPVYHRIDKRITGHIFTTILAYHLLCIIQRGLKQQKINHNWNTIIRNYLRTMVRVTTTLVTEEGKTIYLRQTSEPEPMHIDIFSALGIPQKPLKRVVKVN
jgi:transposase